MKGKSYALWDKVGNEYLSWSWLGFKRAREELFGYFNHKAIAILQVHDHHVQCEVNRESGKRSTKQTVDLELARKKLY